MSEPRPLTGTLPLADVAAVDGLEFLRRLDTGTWPFPPICEVLDFWGTEFELGRAVFEGTPSRSFYNPIGSVHGGWAATLLDSAMGCAVHTALKAGQAYTTLEVKINFVRPITDRTGKVRAEGKLLSAGRSVATAEGRLTDGEGRLLAFGTTTCSVFEIAADRRALG